MGEGMDKGKKCSFHTFPSCMVQWKSSPPWKHELWGFNVPLYHLGIYLSICVFHTEYLSVSFCRCVYECGHVSGSIWV